MSGLAFLVQPSAATIPRLAVVSSTSLLGSSLTEPALFVKSLTTARRFSSLSCRFGNFSRQFSSSEPLLAGAPALAAAAATPGGRVESSCSPSSSSPRKSPRKAAPRRRKPAKFANEYVEAAAAAAELLDLKEEEKKIKINHLLTTVKIETQPLPLNNTNQEDNISDSNFPPALVLQDDAHPIREHLISGAAWTVLLRLRSAGHEACIVGGTVRDMLLNKIPKDYDILTSAEPSEIENLFPRAFVLGRSFPICHVHHDNEVIEVSSFSTNSDPSKIPLDVAAMMTLSGRERTRRGSMGSSGSSNRQGRGGKKGQTISKKLMDKDGSGSGSGWGSALEDEDNDDEDILLENKSLSKNGGLPGPTWATARRDNAIKRDFRVNGLLYDPFSRILYDYVGGTADCTAGILRTMGSPTHSFTQDPARILRAVRLAARVDLKIENETSDAMMALAMSTATLPQGRLQMELAAMFTHGAALLATKLLWRFGLLDMLLPHHAVMLSKQHVARKESESETEEDDNDDAVISSAASHVLFSLLAELDKTASSSKPAETAVWVTAIAAPLVAQECRKEVERRAAAKLRKQRRIEAGDDEERSSSSSSNEWYDVDDIEALVPSSSRTTTKNKNAAAVGKETAKIDDDGSIEEKEMSAIDLNLLPCTPEYLEIYGRIVDKVMARLLSKPDTKTQKHLARIAPYASPLNTGGGVKRKKSGDSSSSSLASTSNGTSSDSNGTSSHSVTTTPAFPILSCVLPRQAVESARSFLKLEAQLRGQDLESLGTYEKQRAGGGLGGKKRSGAQQPRHVGRGKRGRGRKLAANEYMVLQLLRAPSVQWVQATQLAMEDEED
jgi:tRNA nucleotidyltransferase/poly(A) polymerase